MQFGINLAQAMKLKGFTQDQLSEISGVSQGTISRYLNNRAAPKAAELHKLASALGVRMEWLLTGEGEPSDILSRSDKKAAGILSAARDMDPATFKTFLLLDLKAAEPEFDHEGQLEEFRREVAALVDVALKVAQQSPEAPLSDELRWHASAVADLAPATCGWLIALADLILSDVSSDT